MHFEIEQFVRNQVLYPAELRARTGA